MKIPIHIYFFVLSLVLCLSTLTAQDALELETAQLFDTKITWVKKFEGKIAGTHQAILSLGFDGINCRGYIRYASSGDTYLLEGTLQQNNLVLLEKYNDEPSGYVEGNVNNNKIDLNWKSIDQQNSFEANFIVSRPNTNASEAKVLVFEGMQDEKNVKLILRNNSVEGIGTMVDNNHQIERVYTRRGLNGNLSVENLSAGYSFDLVNTKENQYESSFILPGASLATTLKLEQRTSIDIRTKEFLSHGVVFEINLPALEPVFDQHIDDLISAWEEDMNSHKKNVAIKRFGHKAEIWFDLETVNESNISGTLYYNNSWNKKIQSQSFAYHRVRKEMISLAPFLKGTAKWEKAVKERMIAARTLNDTVDEEQFKKWIDKAVLIDPILCADGIQFSTEKNAVFGQSTTFFPWESLSPLVMSSSKLAKLRKSK